MRHRGWQDGNTARSASSAKSAEKQAPRHSYAAPLLRRVKLSGRNLLSSLKTPPFPPTQTPSPRSIRRLALATLAVERQLQSRASEVAVRVEVSADTLGGLLRAGDAERPIGSRLPSADWFTHPATLLPLCLRWRRRLRITGSATRPDLHVTTSFARGPI
jgi:hypothetical protein